MHQHATATDLNRREFLGRIAALSTATGAAALLSACASPPNASETQPVRSAGTSPVAQRQPVAAAKMAKVAFVKTDDRSAGVRAALELLGPTDFSGQDILIKPNFNSSDPAPGSTHPDVLQTLLQQLRQRNAQTMTIADRSGMGDTRRVMESLGVPEIAAAFDASLTVLDELPREEWELIELSDSHWSQGFPIARCCLDADAVVQACCLKTHRYGGHFTMSLKNSVGLVAKRRPGDSYNYMQELHRSNHQRQMIAEINAAYTPALIVMDGVEAFVRGGPASGDKVAANVVLAATDRIAIDAVGVALLRYFGTTPEVSAGPIFAQAQIARAVELGLGVDTPHKIELVTADPESAAYADDIRSLLALG